MDIPYWYWQFSGPRESSLDMAVLRIADRITVMAYQRDVEHVMAVARPEVAHAAEAGKSAFIGINFLPPVDGSLDGTMWGMNHSQVLRAIAMLESQGIHMPGFAGVALHDGDSLIHLR